MREFMKIVEQAEVATPPTCGAIVSVIKRDESDDLNEVLHYYLKAERGWRRQLSAGLQGGIDSFEPTDEYISELADYENANMIYSAPEPGERIKSPIQLLGFPETTTFISPGGRPLRRFGDKIEYEGEQYDLSAISTMTRLSEQVFYNGQPHPIHLVLDELRNNPLAPYVRIFGSAAQKPLMKIPSDIDAFIDLSKTTLPKEQRAEATRSLLAIAHKHYGSFDPFVLITKKTETGLHQILYTRDEHARTWVAAKNADALIAAGQDGIPLSELHDLDLAERAPPTKKGQKFIQKHKAEFQDRYGDNWKGVLYATAWKMFGK